MVGTILGIIILGAIAGAVARLLVPGKDPIGIVGTIVLGIVGSFIGGFIGYALFHHDKSGGFVQPSSWLGSIVGAVIALLVYRRVSASRGVRA